MIQESVCPTCGSALIHDPDDDGMPDDEESHEQWDTAADNVWEWLLCPCERHMFYVGLGAGSVTGFAPHLVIETAIRMIRDELADDERELPDDVDVLRLNMLMPSLFPSDDDAQQDG